MTLTRRAKELGVVTLLLALPVLLLRANLVHPERLNVLDRALLRLSAPLQSGIVAAAEAVVGVVRGYLALVHVARDNRRLVEENTRLRTQLESADSRAAHAGELEKLLALRQSLGYETLAARVIGIETSSYFRVARVQLDRGRDEVVPGMAVLAAAGVVGRVQRVYGQYCDVLLATDPKSSIDVVVPRTRGRGLQKGVAGSDRYRAKIEYLDRNDEAAAGDLVVTSGIGSSFPRDVPVGTIVSVEKGGAGLYLQAEVRPSVDFGKLREVLIVLPREGQPFGPGLPAPWSTPK